MEKPKIEFEDGKMVALTLMPLDLKFDRKDKMNGLPHAAKGEEADGILKLYNDLSNPYGVTLTLSDGMLKII